MPVIMNLFGEDFFLIICNNMTSGTCKSFEHASAVLMSDLRDKWGSVLSLLVMILWRTYVQMFSDNLVNDW